MVNQINSEQQCKEKPNGFFSVKLSLSVWLLVKCECESGDPTTGGLFAIHATQCNIANVAPHSVMWKLWPVAIGYTVQCVKCGATHSNPRHQVAAIFHVLCHIFWFNPSRQRSAISQFHSLSFSQERSVNLFVFQQFRFVVSVRIDKSEMRDYILIVKTFPFLFLTFLCPEQHWGCIDGLDPLWEKTRPTRSPLESTDIDIGEHTQPPDSRMFDTKTASEMHVAPRIVVHCCPLLLSTADIIDCL